MKPISPTSSDVRAELDPAVLSVRGAGWVARRAAIGIACLLVFAFGGALLLHASIDQAAEARHVSDSDQE
jgi:hypothetical protein